MARRAVLALEQLLQLPLVQRFELFAEASAVAQPQPDGLFQRAWDIQQSEAVAMADGQVQGAVRLALPAAAGGLAAGAGPLDQGAAQKGLLGDQLCELGTCVALGKERCGRGLMASPLLF